MTTIYTKFNKTALVILLLGIGTFAFAIYKDYDWKILAVCVFVILMGGWMTDRTPLVSFVQAIISAIAAWRQK